MTTKNGDMTIKPIFLKDDGYVWCEGLTKREQFAMAAMQGLAASGKWHKTKVPCEAVKMADALLAELDKNGD